MYDVQVFFDGECPICVREINLLRRWDRKQRIRFTDIAAEDFDAKAYGKTHSEFMTRIQGRRATGEWIEGVEVFRQLYGAVGFSWAVPLTRLPGVSQSLDFAYRLFAKNRLRLTGRSNCTDDQCTPAQT